MFKTMVQEMCETPTKHLFFLFVSILLVACGESADPQDKKVESIEQIEIPEGSYERISLMPIEDHFELDSILIHNTYELKEGEFMIVSRPSEESFKGLQMHLYRLQDSIPIVSSSSVPAYDSWIYLPTFFVSEDQLDTLILAELGERESWGCRLLRIEDGQFKDLGFIDVALRDSKFDEELEDDVMVLKTIAPFTNILSVSNGLSITFASDSVHVFDDQNGGLDILYPAAAVRYEWTDSLRMVMPRSS